MAKGRGALAWGTTASLVRASILAISGKEPPLESFIPKTYMPDFAKAKLTAEEKELMESLGAETVEEAAAIIRQKKAALDMRILSGSGREIRKG